jgi:RHS repeat-associated protein
VQNPDGSDKIGQAAVLSAFGNAYLFTGRRADKETVWQDGDTWRSGLLYFRMRYYDIMQGRFTARDGAKHLDGLNLYNAYYVPNTTDPYGLFPFLKYISEGSVKAKWYYLSQGSTEGLSYPQHAIHVDITWTPPSDPPYECGCDEAGFVQITAEYVKYRRPTIVTYGPGMRKRYTSGEYWEIDGRWKLDISGNGANSPFYDVRYVALWVKGMPKRPITMTDEPGWEASAWTMGGFYNIKEYRQDFETCVVCRKGKLKGLVSYCVKWSHTQAFEHSDIGWIGYAKQAGGPLFENTAPNEIVQPQRSFEPSYFFTYLLKME